MTDAEVKAIYLKIDPNCIEDDSKWWADAIRTTREAIEAKSFKAAVEVFRRAGWGEPEDCARKILGAKPCPTCHGEGVV